MWLAENSAEVPVPTANGARPAPASANLDTAARISKRGRSALQYLLEAHECAHELGRSMWDFAVEIDVLRRGGMSNSDFRWLICKGFAEQARELSVLGEEARAFRRNNSLTFHRKTCFMLTDSGVMFVRNALSQPVSTEDIVRARLGLESNGVNGVLLPHWDRDRQELRFGHLIVKQYKVPAANQEMILSAFEEEGWPPRIDDPLPQQPHLDPKRRLHDTINSLNRNQKHALIRFLGDGSGEGVRWEPQRTDLLLGPKEGAL